MVLLYNNRTNKIDEVENDEVMDGLYEVKYRVLTENDKEHILKLKQVDTKEFVEEQINEISKIDNKIPLYNPFNENLFLIIKDLVYDRVIRHSYRFPDIKLINKLEKQKIEKEETTNILEQNKYNKLKLMLNFLHSFNLEILHNTYLKVFYYNAEEVGGNITICKRRSFLPYLTHITPYYNKNEIINLGLNIGLIKLPYGATVKSLMKLYDEQLCEDIRENDISSKILIEHQKHIIENNMLGLIQYYSLQGSFFLNTYLRNMTNYTDQNELIEDLIKNITKLINTSPQFDREYYLYRFIKDDGFLSKLTIGDEYVEQGFTSTTRDPFYRSQQYQFGYILIKIHVPKDIIGVALCMETVSYFPKEEEIILAPYSKFVLKKRDEDVDYFHTDLAFKTKIKRFYEFEYVGKENLILRSIKRIVNNEILDFLKIKQIETLTLDEKIRYFIKNYVNDISQFMTKIGNIELTFIVEWYDSSGVYENFYAFKTSNGFSIYSIYENNVVFMIEIGEERYGTVMIVNYYNKTTIQNKFKLFKEEELLLFLSSIAYYFDVDAIFLYTDDISCSVKNSKHTQEKSTLIDIYGGKYCYDFYEYLKNKTIPFNKFNPLEVKPVFSIIQLKKLFNIDPLSVLKREDSDELYQIYKRIYKEQIPSKLNLANFFIYIIDNYCYLTDTLIDKLNKIYNIDNPFNMDYYLINPNVFLYNNGYISSYKEKEKVLRYKDIEFLSKNKYRISEQREQRLKINNISIPRKRLIK